MWAVPACASASHTIAIVSEPSAKDVHQNQAVGRWTRVSLGLAWSIAGTELLVMAPVAALLTGLQGEFLDCSRLRDPALDLSP